MWSSADAAPAAPTKNLGMTAPISTAGPEPRDLELTSGLQDSLIPHGCFESEEELNHRMDVLRLSLQIYTYTIYNLNLTSLNFVLCIVQG